MKPLLIIVMIVVSLMLMSGSAYSADSDKGFEAYIETALAEWKPLAEQGDARAQHYLGKMYAIGLRDLYGVPLLQDYKEAAKWFRLAAEQGHADAQYNLGEMYHKGEGVLQDYKKAVKWYRLAAEQGDAMGQFNLGFKYNNGDGVPQDSVYAHMWWNIASVNGSKGSSKNRDLIAKDMTPSQIAKAQELARQCMKKEYRDC